MAVWKNRISSTNYETEKITRKASDAAEYIELFGSSTRDRHARRNLSTLCWWNGPYLNQVLLQLVQNKVTSNNLIII